MSYAIAFSNRAAKDIRSLPVKLQKTVKAKLAKLAGDPYEMTGVKKLSSPGSIYRLRVGEYRILYTIENQRLLITVVRVGPRGNVYKGF